MTQRRFAKNEVLDLSEHAGKIMTSSAIRLGIHFDTVSGAVRCSEDAWQPVMLCGRNTVEQFRPEKILVLADEAYELEEALRVSWKAHARFHDKEVQEHFLQT